MIFTALFCKISLATFTEHVVNNTYRRSATNGERTCVGPCNLAPLTINKSRSPNPLNALRMDVFTSSLTMAPNTLDTRTTTRSRPSKMRLWDMAAATLPS